MKTPITPSSDPSGRNVPSFGIRAFQRLLFGLPRGHFTLMRWYAGWFGNGDGFWGTVDGLAWRVNLSDPFISCGAFRDGVHEPVVTRMIRHLVRPGSVFVDAGANRGYFTLIACRQAGDSGRVVAIEPFPPCADVLRQNLEANGFDFATVIESALWKDDGGVSFHAPRPGNAGTGRILPGAGPLIPTATLDALADRIGIAHIDVLKMDIEGAEVQALSGASRLFSEHRIRNLIIEMHPSLIPSDDIHTIPDRLSACGYQCRRLLTAQDASIGRKAFTDTIPLEGLSTPFDPKEPAAENWNHTFWWSAP